MIQGDLRAKALHLQGPILVLGASGFIGANLLRLLLKHRSDVYGTSSNASAWRLEGLPPGSIMPGDLLVSQGLTALLDTVRPRTVFNFLAYGAYSFQTDTSLIYRTNVELTAQLIEELQKRGLHCYIHAGSSSEYGDDASGPAEGVALHPNSHYSVSKGAAAGLIELCRKETRALPASICGFIPIYGPYEDLSAPGAGGGAERPERQT